MVKIKIWNNKIRDVIYEQNLKEHLIIYLIVFDFYHALPTERNHDVFRDKKIQGPLKGTFTSSYFCTETCFALHFWVFCSSPFSLFLSIQKFFFFLFIENLKHNKITKNNFFYVCVELSNYSCPHMWVF